MHGRYPFVAAVVSLPQQLKRQEYLYIYYTYSLLIARGNVVRLWHAFGHGHTVYKTLARFMFAVVLTFL